MLILSGNDLTSGIFLALAGRKSVIGQSTLRRDSQSFGTLPVFFRSEEGYVGENIVVGAQFAEIGGKRGKIHCKPRKSHKYVALTVDGIAQRGPLPMMMIVSLTSDDRGEGRPDISGIFTNDASVSTLLRHTFCNLSRIMSVFVRVRLVSARDDLQGIVELHVDCGSESRVSRVKEVETGFSASSRRASPSLWGGAERAFMTVAHLAGMRGMRLNSPALALMASHRSTQRCPRPSDTL